MNTPAHLIIGAAAFARPGQPLITAAAILGALAPDLSLYVMAGVSLFVLGFSPERVFNELYFSAAWQTVFAIDNSFVIWGAVLGTAALARIRWLMVLAAAALLHLALDFPFHNDDARRHFWPVSDWVFVSPVSYWDTNHYGGIVGLAEAGLAAVLCVLLWRRFRSSVSRIMILGICVLELAPALFWAFVFRDGA